ncbi:MAG: hypothetical protein RL514_930 [Verrucomicrobiota bacterium]|jgi:hypothetical protein
MLALIPGVVSGQVFSLEVSRVSAGGGYSAVGDLALVCTIGQAEAGTRVTWGSQVLETGFLPAAGLHNAAPTLAEIPNPAAILEDAREQTLNLGGISAGPVDDSWQVLTVTATSSNPGLIPNPAVTYTSPNATGTLKYTPVPDANGTALITVVVRDDGGTANGGVDAVTNTFTITVMPVNDAPSVTFSQGTVTVLEDAGPQSRSGFAAFSPGPANESTQTLVGYTVTVDNTALFSAAPAINDAGVLTFTPATNANGSATVTVVAQDNGGVVGGGVDKRTNTFVIVVTPVNDTPVAVPDSYTMNQGDVLTVGGITSVRLNTALGVLANDTDVENDTLTALKLSDPSHGSVTLNANGSFSYTPSATFFGPDSFTYRSSDASSNSTPATVSILVYARPTNSVPGSQTVFSSAALRFSATNTVNNSIRVGDPDSTALTVSLTVTNGTVLVSVTNGLTFANGLTNNTNVVLSGLSANVNAALESLGYTSKTNYFGDETLVIVTTDEGGRTNRGNGFLSILVEIPARGASLEVPLQGLNNNNTGLMVTNATAISLDTNLVQGVSFDPTNNVITVLPVGGQDGSTNRSTVTVLVRFNDGSTQLVTVPVIIYQPLLTATTNSGTYDSTFSTPIFNPQTSLYEQKVTVQNNTPFGFTALRITATNLPATVTLQNATLTNGGLPYIEHNLTVPSGRSVTLKLEYFSSDFGIFTPGLRLELLNQQRAISAPAATVMTAVALRTGYSPDRVAKIYVQFPSRAGQLYYVQYADALGAAWRTSPVTVTGTGFVVQFIDDGPPNTDTAPGRARFYRVLTPP